MEHYTELRTWEQDGYTIQVAYAPESCHPGDCFDDTAYNIMDICDKINRGVYDWFILRVTVLALDAVLATEYVGGMLYSRVEEVFEDGVVDDMVYAATVTARERASVLKAQLERILATETV